MTTPSEAQPRTLRTVLQIVVPVVLIAVAALVTVKMVKSFEPPERAPLEIKAPLVRVHDVVRGPQALVVKTQGTVLPRTQASLVPEVSGRVMEISPALVAGGFFSEDEVLLKVESADYKQAVAQANSVVAQAELRLAREEADAAVARDEWDELGNGPGNPLALRELQVKEARAALDAAREALARAKRDLARTEIRAPFDGRVRQENVDLGQFVTRGAPIATVYAVDYAEVRLPVPDDQLAFVDLPLGRTNGKGPAVTLRATFAGATQEWNGTVVRTEGEIDPRTRMVHAIARVARPYEARGGKPPLAVGMFVEAEIEGRALDEVVVLPRAALRDATRCLVIDDESKLRFREIEVIRQDGDEVVVRAGLETGERVCLTPLDTVVEGMPVRVRDADEAGEEA